jgi:hypothetical protein
VINNVSLFTKLVFTTAAKTPIKTPTIKANAIATNANINVLGNASDNIVPTDLLL